MAPTHVAAGVALAAPVALLAPEFAPVVVAAAVAGSVFPDLDMVAGEHRRTLHAVEAYALLAVLTAFAAVVAPSAPTVAVTTFFVSAALHPLLDLAGGSSEARPWEAATDRGVYLRSRERWVAPKRWARYDGAPEDLALTAVLLVPGVVVFGDAVRGFAAATLAVGVVYALARKRIPQLSGRINLPVPPVLTAVLAVLSLFRR
ncbi:hypothetical protein [Halogeometricum luteum]|uniref:LexA-binding, inner membrane-associated hydrolase n=1 Tax=Halogeometricum luteum TaxID=2950537 RepID=A0ABU2G011_9EURY|nr:hypothetical protein [Halogeometricum sp. S3BR5-2]MDS0294120.1 hypothetical protein [Halogeometricum sp. S3BR5-2]